MSFSVQERINRRQFVGLVSAAGVGAIVVAGGNRINVNAAPKAQGTPSASPAASPGASPAAGSAAFEVKCVDIGFDPKTLTIPANMDVVVTVNNTGFLQHDFAIDALNVKTELLDGGTTQDVTINAAPGDYEYYCSVPGHKEQGMVGTLTVQ